MRQAHSTIENELRRAGIGGDDAMRRARIARAIFESSAFFGEREAARVRAHFAKGFVGMAAVEAVEAALLNGTWVEIDEAMRDQERERAEDPNAKSADSSLARVSEGNPYGWSRPDRTQALDHDRPGEWNAYRQAKNLTAQERRDSGARDHRVRGCTRWEVLGTDRAPKVEFDTDEVAAAMAKVSPAAAAAAEASGREVYGHA